MISMESSMDMQVVSLLLFIVSLLVSAEGRIIAHSSKSPDGKTMLIVYGETYDCVDFYKQPAFHHPMLKNFTFDYKMMSSFQNFELEGEGCPVGTVPIRKSSKVDLSREKKTNNDANYYNAAARKTSTESYTGAGAYISLHNPKSTGRQYSAARVRLQNGPNSIEAGWRVDPKLYGDSQTRFYVHTDSGQKTRCFNVACPGFVLLAPKPYLGTPITNISIPGRQPIPELRVDIIRDNKGNWNLHLGEKGVVFGFWPSSIFKYLTDFTYDIEWGGQVFDPSPIPTVQMGAGRPLKGDGYDAFFRQCSEYDKAGKRLDAYNIKAFSTSKFYSANSGVYGMGYNSRVLYGGPN